IVTVYPKNKHVDLPTIHGSVAIKCNKTGKSLAMLDGTYLTGVRTGAIGGNAIRHLAKENVKRLAVLGAGTQGFYQILAACEERDLECIYIYNRTKGEKLTHFVKKIRKYLSPNIRIEVTDTVEEAIE